ncbi:hypothetical protein VTK73DRAFT_6122 [Phialemonium thermophilum]|uniref:Uncharacterized protein n=1 Tax=Phialemonium thermophilum TaxID=223376 RepID=A0ABR3WL02_9PEZI
MRQINDRAVASRAGPHDGPGIGLTMTEPPTYPSTDAAAAGNSRADTPVASYIPIGVHDSPLPMGKYYPSNYEKRKPASNPKMAQPPPTRLPHASQSDFSVPRRRTETGNTRLDSDARRRLKQYQRDMIAQATLAASQLLGSNTKPGGSAADSVTSVDNVLTTQAQLGGSLARGHKPISPRLLPLGSPGPVTPIDLEGGGDSYLTGARDITAAAESRRERSEVALFIRTDEERRGRETARSPIPSR